MTVQRLAVRLCVFLPLLPLVLVLSPSAHASQIHFRKLRDVVGGATVILVARVDSITRPDREHLYRFLYQTTVKETLVGRCDEERLSVILSWPSPYGPDGIIESPLLPASGVEFDFEEGEDYVLLFYDLRPGPDGHVSLLRAEPVEKRDEVLRLWKEQRAQQEAHESEASPPGEP